MKVGTRVRYTGKFLRDIGCYAGEIGLMVGTIQELKDLNRIQIAKVRWDDGELRSANVDNLCEIGKPDYS